MIAWLPLVAIAAHLVEEFVWPGGFAAWYRRVWPERAASVTTTFLVGINALNVLAAIGAGQWFDRPVGLGLWLVVASLAAANGVFHLRAVLRTGVYSPGVVTGSSCTFRLPPGASCISRRTERGRTCSFRRR